MKWLQTGETVTWKQQGNEVVVHVPAAALKTKTPALAFAFTPAAR
jgi:hypothetical protein